MLFSKLLYSAYIDYNKNLLNLPKLTYICTVNKMILIMLGMGHRLQPFLYVLQFLWYMYYKNYVEFGSKIVDFL